MRFYVEPKDIFLEKNEIEIKDKKEIHHICNVMRLKKGVSLHVFDGRGNGYSGEIKEINKKSVIIEIKKAIDFKKDFPYSVTLYQAVPKKGKMDFIIEKSVELGVDTVVPIITERTEVSFKDKGHRKIERWNRVMLAASKQCGRENLPIMSNIIDFNNALIESKKNDLVIFAALDEGAKPLKEILKNLSPKNISLFIGPEGDFSHNEVFLAKEQGYTICSLGPLVLRVETASLYILSCLNYEYANR